MTRSRVDATKGCAAEERDSSVVLRGGEEISFHENPLSAWKEDLGRGPTEGKEKRSGVGLLVGRAVWEYAGSGTPFASGGQDIGQRNQQLHTVGRAQWPRKR